MNNTRLLIPGSQFFFTRAGLVFPVSTRTPRSEVSRRGQTVTVTQDLIDANTDRFGNCWLDLVSDEVGQIERWGEVKFQAGAAPAGFTPWDPDSEAERDLQREWQRGEAAKITDDRERKREMDRIARELGRVPTSKTINGVDR